MSWYMWVSQHHFKILFCRCSNDSGRNLTCHASLKSPGTPNQSFRLSCSRQTLLSTLSYINIQLIYGFNLSPGPTPSACWILFQANSISVYNCDMQPYHGHTRGRTRQKQEGHIFRTVLHQVRNVIVSRVHRPFKHWKTGKFRIRICQFQLG